MDLWVNFYSKVHAFMAECACVPEPLRSTVTCLCLSDIPVFLETNDVAIAAVALEGELPISDILTQVVCGQWFKLCMTSA